MNTTENTQPMTSSTNMTICNGAVEAGLREAIGEEGDKREGGERRGERRGRRGRAQQRNHCGKQKILRVENERMKCGMCAQTRPYDKVTLFLT